MLLAPPGAIVGHQAQLVSTTQYCTIQLATHSTNNIAATDYYDMHNPVLIVYGSTQSAISSPGLGGDARSARARM